MHRRIRLLRPGIPTAATAFSIVLLLSAIIFISGGVTEKEFLVAQKRIGKPRLISIDPLPEPAADGESCPWMPASGTNILAAALQEESGAGDRSALTEAGATVDFSKRKPVRTIRDPYAAYSSVAVDPNNNEVVLTDENLFNILVYDRMASTPPQAAMTEPKRMIGGVKTNIEFQCGLYIDPQNGDIYAVNNDTVNTLVIFSRQARGDVPPDREIETPHGTFGIAVDEAHQELMLTIQHDAAIVTYRKDAGRKDSPIRLLQGDDTLLQDPHGLALDTKHDMVFVSNHGTVHYFKPLNNGGGTGLAGTGGRSAEGRQNWPQSFGDAILGSGKNLPPSITVYPRTASGDTAPLRVIQGSKTRLNWPTGLSYDPRTDELFVANDMGDEILVFSGTANGDVAPSRIIRGPKSHIKNPTGVYVDLQNDELWVANFGNHSATVYKPSASGDTPPLRVVRSGPENRPSLGIGNPHPVGYDSKRDQILVPN